jgi:tetratricopeptide (TPR) repeat protein
VTDQEIAADLGAETLISGIVTLQGEELEISAQITDVSTGSVLRPVSASGPRSGEMDVVDLLRGRVMGAVAASNDAGLADVGFGEPPTYEAYQAGLRGLRALLVADLVAAMEESSLSHRLDPTYLGPLSVEAVAAMFVGDRSRADSVLGILEARSDELSPYLRYFTGYWRASLNGDIEEMLRTSRLLVREDPWMNGFLAAAALMRGHPDEALEAMAVLPSLNWRTGEENVQQLFTPAAHLMLGRYDAALSSIDSLPLGLRGSIGTVPLEIHALLGLGRWEEAEGLLGRVEELDPGPNPVFLRPGQVYRSAAALQARFAHDTEAQRTAERALAWYADHPEAGTDYDRARILLLAGHPAGALELIETSQQDGPGSFTYRSMAGMALSLAGDREGAEAHARWFEDTELPDGRGLFEYWKAALFAHLDRKEEAVRALRQALQEGRQYYYLTNVEFLWADPNFRPLWGYEPFEEAIAPRG